MNKALILKAFGGSEEEFYKMYPTEAHFKMAMGGDSPFKQFFQKGGQEEDLLSKEKRLEKAKKAASKVTTVDKDMQLIGEDAGRTYYDREYKSSNLDPNLVPKPTKDKDKYNKHIIGLLEQGYSLPSLVKAKLISPESAPEFEKYYKAAYTEKEKQPEKEKNIDLGIGWAGQRLLEPAHYLPQIKDPKTGAYVNAQKYKIPAVWDEKTKSWDTSGAWNQGTVITGYTDSSGKFVTFDEANSKLAYEGEKPYYSKEGFKYPSYVQSGEDQKVLTTGPLKISGATAMDVNNTGMNYNQNKDVVAPINTQGTGMGIGKDKLINTVGAENLPATNSMVQQLQNLQQFGGVPDFYNPPYLLMSNGGYIPILPEWMKMGGAPCYECGGQKMENGGLSRSEDYGSEKKPYPSVSSSDFAGGGRSYPIPTKADAIDALRLAGLHGRSDVRAKVFAKYPELKKQSGGTMSADLEGTYPQFNYGGLGYQMGADPSIPYLNQAKNGMETYPGQTEQSKQNQITSQFLNYIQNQTMNALMRDEKKNVDQMFMQMGGNNPYGYNPNMNNQQAFYNAAAKGKERFQQDMSNFFGATQNLNDTMTPYTQTSITPMAADGIQVMRNPATGELYSPEEYAYLKKHFETPAKTDSSTQSTESGKVQPWYQRHGKSYFPMNYNPVMQMSDKDIAVMEQLAKNPTTNLKEFHAKKRLFGDGVRRIDMVFGAKDALPEFKEVKPEFNPGFQATTAADLAKQRQFVHAQPAAKEEEFKPTTKGGWTAEDYMKGVLRGDPTFKPGFNPHLPAQAYGGMPKYQGDIFGSQTGYGAWGYQGAQQPQFSTPESVGIKQPAINQVKMQDTGAPITSANTLPQGTEKQYKVTQKFKNKWDPEASVNWGLAGANAVASMFEQRDAQKNFEKWKALQGADNQFYSMPGGNRGDYDQFGNFRPNQKVPVQFAGQNFGQASSPYTFQEGGEYYMSDDQIQAILNSGGDVEFLD